MLLGNRGRLRFSPRFREPTEWTAAENNLKNMHQMVNVSAPLTQSTAGSVCIRFHGRA